MRSGLLRGREHTKLGAVATLAEGRCAIAISRGGYRKAYPHRDPNEDAAAYAIGAQGMLLAVADGHGGHEAAEQALATLLERFAGAWTGAGALGPAWEEQARGALERLHAEIVGRGSRDGNPEARTTLALAVTRPDEGLLGFASVGDSHVFATGGDEATDLAAARDEPTGYLGSPSLDPSEIAGRARIGSVRLADLRALALATDGLSEIGIGVEAPGRAVLDALADADRALPEIAALEAGRGIVDRALASHRRQRAGDNVAAAVAVLAR